MSERKRMAGFVVFFLILESIFLGCVVDIYLGSRYSYCWVRSGSRAGYKPDSQVNSNVTDEAQNPHITPINTSITNTENDTSGTHQIQCQNTSLHKKCAIDMQRDRVLAAFEQIPESLQELVLTWDSLPTPARNDVLRFIDQTLESRDVTQGDQDDQPDPIPPA